MGLGVPLSVAMFKASCWLGWACGVAVQQMACLRGRCRCTRMCHPCAVPGSALVCTPAMPHNPACTPNPLCPLQLLPYGSSGAIVALYGVAFTIWGLTIRCTALSIRKLDCCSCIA